MRIALSTLGQTLLLLLSGFAGFLAGVAVPALRLPYEVARTASYVRTFDFDWVVAVLLVYALLLFSAARHRARTGWLPSTLALVLTLAILLLFTRLGFKETPLI